MNVIQYLTASFQKAEPPLPIDVSPERAWVTPIPAWLALLL